MLQLFCGTLELYDYPIRLSGKGYLVSDPHMTDPARQGLVPLPLLRLPQL